MLFVMVERIIPTAEYLLLVDAKTCKNQKPMCAPMQVCDRAVPEMSAMFFILYIYVYMNMSYVARTPNL